MPPSHWDLLNILALHYFLRRTVDIEDAPMFFCAHGIVGIPLPGLQAEMPPRRQDCVDNPPVTKNTALCVLAGLHWVTRPWGWACQQGHIPRGSVPRRTQPCFVNNIYAVPGFIAVRRSVPTVPSGPGSGQVQNRGHGVLLMMAQPCPWSRNLY